MIQSRSYQELLKVLRLHDPSIADYEAIDISQRLINEVKNGGELFFKNLAATSLRYRMRHLNLIHLATQISENAVEIQFPNWFLQQLWQEQEEQYERELHSMCEAPLLYEDFVQTTSPPETSIQKSNFRIRIPKQIFESISTKRGDLGNKHS